jgi:chemotaxis protein MotB
MKKKFPFFILFIATALFLIAGCVARDKYEALETDYQRAVKNLDDANVNIAEKDTQISELQQQLEQQKTTSEKEIESVKMTNDELVSSLKKEIEEGNIQIRQIKGMLTMSIAAELFFESGKADIKDRGKEVLNTIGGILKKIPQKNIRVEGYTDSVPIGPPLLPLYPTNWELGASRAVNVVRFLEEKVGIDPLRLSAVSYGQFRPSASNKTAAGRAKNRMIEIVLVDRNLDLAKKMRENLSTK